MRQKTPLNIERQKKQKQKEKEPIDSPRQAKQLEKEEDPDKTQQQLEENEVNQLLIMCFEAQKRLRKKTNSRLKIPRQLFFWNALLKFRKKTMNFAERLTPTVLMKPHEKVSIGLVNLRSTHHINRK